MSVCKTSLRGWTNSLDTLYRIRYTFSAHRKQVHMAIERIPRYNFGDFIEKAQKSLKVIVWAESGDRVVEAYTCDTQQEVLAVKNLLASQGEIYQTQEYQA